MWKVPPELMCDKHLLGEHLEMHMFSAVISSGKSIDGYLKGGLVEPNHVIARHEELVKEMIKRRMNHQSPIEHFTWDGPEGFVDGEINMIVLADRC